VSAASSARAALFRGAPVALPRPSSFVWDACSLRRRYGPAPTATSTTTTRRPRTAPPQLPPAFVELEAEFILGDGGYELHDVAEVSAGWTTVQELLAKSSVTRTPPSMSDRLIGVDHLVEKFTAEHSGFSTSNGRRLRGHRAPVQNASASSSARRPPPSEGAVQPISEARLATAGSISAMSRCRRAVGQPGMGKVGEPRSPPRRGGQEDESASARRGPAVGGRRPQPSSASRHTSSQRSAPGLRAAASSLVVEVTWVMTRRR